ncbi:MAG: DUF3037 domain-containing protein, partial [Candidatus Limnocylindrales bacterium]
MPALPRSPFAYTVLRAVPRVERAEFINAGVVLFCREWRFLEARTGLDPVRLTALAPDCDTDEIVGQLAAIQRVASGDASAGPIAKLAKAERFQWLASPSSTMVQRSEVHTGLTHDPASTLDHLFRTQVMTPGARLPRHEGWSRAHRLSSAPDFVGRVITHVRRLHYVFQGEVNTSDGAIEITFGDGSVMMCDSAADWTLEFYAAAWVDPFDGTLNESDRDYVGHYGRWSAYDVTAEAP